MRVKTILRNFLKSAVARKKKQMDFLLFFRLFVCSLWKQPYLDVVRNGYVKYTSSHKNTYDEILKFRQRTLLNIWLRHKCFPVKIPKFSEEPF